MSKKERKIQELENQIKELKQLNCTNETLQLARYCSDIEKAVNDPKFEPGSLKLVPRVSQALSCYEIASEVEIVISVEHNEEQQETDKCPLDCDKMWKIIDRLIFENNILEARLKRCESTSPHTDFSKSVLTRRKFKN